MLRRDGAFSSSMVDHVPFVRHVHAATGQAQVRKVDTGQADRRVTSATPSGTSQAWQWRRKTKERKIQMEKRHDAPGTMCCRAHPPPHPHGWLFKPPMEGRQEKRKVPCRCPTSGMGVAL